MDDFTELIARSKKLVERVSAPDVQYISADAVIRQVAPLAEALEAQLAEITRVQAAVDGVKSLLDSADSDGFTWWNWIEDGIGGTLHSDLQAILASAGSSSAHDAECEDVVVATSFTGCGCEARRSSSALEAAKADTPTRCAHSTAAVKFDGGGRSVVCDSCRRILTRLSGPVETQGGSRG